MRQYLLALCMLTLCGCGDGRIVRALNSVPATYPTYSTQIESVPDWRSDSESQLRNIESQLDDIRQHQLIYGN
jgi:hypothetical protein